MASSRSIDDGVELVANLKESISFNDEKEPFVKKSFDKFLEERLQYKQSIYFKVSLVGLAIALSSYALFVLLTFVLQFQVEALYPYTAYYNIYALSVTFLRVFGLCMCAVVPTNELDYIGIVLKNKKYIFRFSCFAAFVMIACGFYSLANFALPLAAQARFLYGLQLVIIIIIAVIPFWMIGAWHLLSLRSGLTYNQLQKKCKYTILMVPYILVFMIAGGNVWQYFMYGDASTSIDVSAALGAASLVVPFGLVLLYQLFVDNAILINRILGREIVKIVDESETEGAGMLSLYMLFYRIFAGVTLCFWIDAASSFTTYPLLDSISWAQIFLGWSDILPILIALYYGQKRCFSLLARYFEYDVGRQRSDGCFMVILIKSCQELPENGQGTKIRWFHRKTDDTRFPLVNGSTFRRRWLTGQVTHGTSTSSEISLLARLRDDCDIESAYLFDSVSVKCVIHEVTNSSNNSSNIPEIMLFDDWYNNIDYGSSSKFTMHRVDEIEAASFRVVLDPTPTEEELTRIKLGLTSKFDLENLPSILAPLKQEIAIVRQFDTSFFKENSQKLLGASPRDVSDAEVGEWKRLLKSFANPVTVRRNNDKVDFFLSHSWSDNTNKIEALNWFIQKFKCEHGRYPTLWFDRVCVDQDNVTDGISLLPIHIGACNCMLILMGKTYMGRLWCIWELFMLFTFCNTDLALERIQILCIEEDFDPVEAIRTFDINAAHCYDPNEEFRLRYLMLEVVGADALKNSIKAMEKLDAMGRIVHLNTMKQTGFEYKKPEPVVDMLKHAIQFGSNCLRSNYAQVMNLSVPSASTSANTSQPNGEVSLVPTSQV